jgi:hypothetical protein
MFSIFIIDYKRLYVLHSNSFDLIIRMHRTDFTIPSYILYTFAKYCICEYNYVTPVF